MKLSGFDKIIKGMLKKDEIVYAGYSAGWCILSKSLKGLEIVDNPKDNAEGYPKKIVWSGLGIIDYMACPHYKSDHPESADDFRKKKSGPFDPYLSDFI